MNTELSVAIIAAIPASIGAIAAWIAARRSGVGNKDVSEVKDMLTAHIENTAIHVNVNHRTPLR